MSENNVRLVPEPSTSAAWPETPEGATRSSLEPRESTLSADLGGATPTPPAAATSPAIDPTLSLAQLGPYQLLEKLGEGGMGAVYKARHKKLDKLVAIKLLPAPLTRDPDALARFEREMKAVGKLEHPNIARAMDAGEAEGTHYLTMELVEGQNLQQVIRKRGKQPVATACKLVRQTALALAYAHQHGLVHRDIKPSNLILAKSGQLKVLDLGLARLAQDEGQQELTSTGQMMGTPDYMAPEQWKDSHDVDARCDLYALGCTLFFLLVGRAPFGDDQHGSTFSKMHAHVSEPIPDLRAVRPDVPEELAAIYAALLAKSPSDRPADAKTVADLLVPFCKATPGDSANPSAGPATVLVPASSPATVNVSEPSATADSPPQTTITFVPTTPPQPPGKPRRRTLAYAGGAALLILFGAIIIKIVNSGDPTAPPKPPAMATELATTPSAPASDSIDFAAERKATEALLKLNKGKMYLANDQTSWEMQLPLPPEPFWVSDVCVVQADITDQEIAVLAGCRGILKLDVRINPRLTAAGLKKIGPLPRLETLLLDDTACTRESLEFLSNYPRLVTLTTSGETREGIMQTLPPCPRLNSLTTPYQLGSVGDEGLRTIVRHCPQLTELNLTDSQQYSLVPLSRLRKLEKLHCWGGLLNDAAIAALAELPNFDSLGIEAPDPQCVTRLAKLDQKIRELAMRNQNGLKADMLTETADWEPLTRFANLEQLTIMEFIVVDAASLQAVAAMPSLKSFSVYGDFSAEDREKLRPYTSADVAAFRQARPDVLLNIDGQEYPATLTNESKS